MKPPKCVWGNLFLFFMLFGNGRSVNNDATEMINGHLFDVTTDVASDDSLNRARNGGRRLIDAQQDGSDHSQVGCRELRSTKYIFDGQCTSLNPVKELVCAGECLPAHLLPNWIGAGYTGRHWSRGEAQDWRCVIDRARTQRIRLQCQDGSSRTYRIAVVTSCKCKRYTRQQNQSERPVSKGQAEEGAQPAGRVSKRRKEQKTTMGPPLGDGAGKQADMGL